MICRNCRTEHPSDQAGNPHYCVARLTEEVDRLDGLLREIEEHDHRFVANLPIMERGFYDAYDPASARQGHAEGHRCAAEIARRRHARNDSQDRG